MAAKLHGDESELYAKHHDRLIRTVKGRVSTSRANVEDACSYAWFQLMRTDPGRGFPVLAWLTTVAVREAIRLERRDRRPTELTDHLGESLEDRKSDLSTAAEAREALRALADLPPRQRDALGRKIAGFSYDEISEQTGDSWRTVERQLLRARRRLRGA